MKRIIGILMICVLTFSMALYCFAENKNTLVFKANIVGTFEVELPQNIILTESEKQVPYSVKADIPGNNLLLVSMKNNIRLTDKNGNIYDAVLANNKDRYESNEIVEKNTQQFTITAENLPAGSWTGDIEVIVSNKTVEIENAGLYDEQGILLVSWEELITTYGLDVKRDYDGGYDTRDNPTSPVKVLANFPTAHTLIIPGNIGYIGEYVFYDTVLPKVILMEGITTLKTASFFNCSIDEIVLPNTLADIQMGAFQRSPIKKLIIPSSVVNINDMAFTINQIEDFSIENNNLFYISENELLLNKEKTIAISAMNNSVTEYIIPEGIKELNSLLFRDMENVTNIILPNSLEIIENQVFQGTSITTIYIPKDVKKIGECILSFCDNLTSITVDEDNLYFCSVDGALYSKDMKILYAFPSTKTGSYIIPEGVEIIKKYAFFNSQLQSLTLPNSLKEIEYGAIAQTKIKSLTIPANVKKIGDSAFHANYYLNELKVDEKNKHYISINNVLYDKDKTTLIVAATNRIDNIIIPDGVETIMDYAFFNAKYTSITLPSTLKTIKEGAFAYCSKLTSLTVPSTVETIEDYAFGSIPIVYYNGNATGSPWMAKKVIKE